MLLLCGEEVKNRVVAREPWLERLSFAIYSVAHAGFSQAQGRSVKRCVSSSLPAVEAEDQPQPRRFSHNEAWHAVEVLF